MLSLPELQRRYARLAVQIGLGLRPGQTLFIWKAPVEAAAFVRLIVEQAYQQGARDVEVFWSDDELRRMRLFRNGGELCTPLTMEFVQRMVAGAETGGAYLLFDCTCSGLFEGLDLRTFTGELECEGRQLERIWDPLARGTVNWTMLAVPVTSWATRIYPDLSANEAMDMLWRDLAVFTRLDSEDPPASWRRHCRRLQSLARRLNAHRFARLHLSAPGTELTLDLPGKHLWRGCDFRTPSGIPYVPDLPMEEVFTLPHRLGASGTLRSTMPLVIKGAVIDAIDMVFEQGRVVSIQGSPSVEVLRRIVSEEPGTDRLGEVALVPADSPIASKRRLYYNTILDENAGCHLALGRAYRFTMRDAAGLSDREFQESGGNLSGLHIDIVIGGRELIVDGEGLEGRRNRIYDAGRWALGSENGDRDCADTA